MKVFTEFSEVEALLIACILIGFSMVIAKLARSKEDEQ